MALDRAAAVAFLTGTQAALLTEAGRGLDDEAGQLQELIDQALLRIGVPYATRFTPVIADTDALAFYEALRLEALRATRDALVVKGFDVQVEGAVRVLYSQRIAQLDSEIRASEHRLADVAGGGGFGTGTIVIGDLIRSWPEGM